MLCIILVYIHILKIVFVKFGLKKFVPRKKFPCSFRTRWRLGWIIELAFTSQSGTFCGFHTLGSQLLLFSYPGKFPGALVAGIENDHSLNDRKLLELFFKIDVLKNLANFKGKHLCWSLFLTYYLLYYLLLKRDSSTGVFL